MLQRCESCQKPNCQLAAFVCTVQLLPPGAKMKTLLLLRHAKSSRDDPRLSDFDRPLNDRGKDDAKLVGRYLRKQKIKIDVIVTSPARRARRTAERVLEAAGLANQLVFDERIYEASAAQLLKVISEIDVTADVAFFIG